MSTKCPGLAQECLLTALGNIPPFRDDDGSPRLPSGTQAIITSYKFGCCGNITTWQTYVEPGGDDHQGVYDISFQVWRPSPTVQESGCFSLVGENKFTSISLGDGGLVSKTPEPSNILTVQPGDVVGYYTISRGGMGDGLQLDKSQNIDSIWYHTISESFAPGTADCPLPVGIDKILTSFTNGSPVLSVTMSKCHLP